MFDLTSHFQDGGDEVISRKKVLPPGECTRSSAWHPLLHMQQRPPAAR